MYKGKGKKKLYTKREKERESEGVRGLHNKKLWKSIKIRGCIAFDAYINLYDLIMVKK